MDNPEITEGIELLESIWYITAVKIIELAIDVYKLDKEQSTALKDVFLKQNNYYVVLSD